MKLNHINLVVSDVISSVNLFETYFDFKCTAIKGDNIVAVLEGEGNFTLVIMAAKQGEVTYHEAFHIGFMMDSEDEVTKLYERLKNSEVPVTRAPAKIRDSFGFYFHFDRFMIEVGHTMK